MKFFLFFTLISSSYASVIPLTITSDLTGLFKDRDRDTRHYWQGELTSNETTAPGKIKIRGNRRSAIYEGRPVCDFPPLKIKMHEDFLFFKKDKGVKFVSHCNDKEQLNDVPAGDIPGGNNYLLQEYFLYQLQNLLYEFSYQTKLSEVTYEDTSGQIKSIQRYGFFLERSKDIAKRFNLKYIDKKTGFPLEKLHGDSFIKSHFFNWFIGNGDASIRLPDSKQQIHNFKIFEDTKGMLHPLAYDFNQVWLRDDPYTSFFTLKVLCGKNSKEQFLKIAKSYLSKRAELFNLLSKIPLEKKYKDKLTGHFNTRFRIIKEQLLKANQRFEITPQIWMIYPPNGGEPYEEASKYFCDIRIISN